MNGDDNIRGDLKSLHLLESDMLKRQWVTYVFEAVEKLHGKVEANTLQVQKEREEFFRALVELKDKLNDKLTLASKEQTTELKLLDEKLLKFIDEVTEKFNTINISFNESISLCATKQISCIDDIKNGIEEKIEDIVTDQVTVKLNLTEIKAQFGAYIAMIVVGVNVVLGVLATSLVVVFKDAIRNWLGY